MKSKKLILVLIIALIVLLFLAGGVFAYMYFATDFLKSNKELFGKYGKLALTDVNEFIKNEQLETYVNKKSNNRYKGNGTIKLELNNKEHNMSFNSMVDNPNKMAEYQVNYNYADPTVNFPFTVVKDEAKIGLSASEIIAGGAFLAYDTEKEFNFVDKSANNNEGQVENNNFLLNITTNLDKLPINNLDIFTISEVEELENKYINLVKDKFADSNFSKAKIGNNMVSYELTISPDKRYEIESELLKNLRTESLILDKLDSGLRNIYQDKIDNLISELDNSRTNMKEMKISVNNANNISNININSEDLKISISCSNQNSLEIDMEIDNDKINNLLKEKTTIKTAPNPNTIQENTNNANEENINNNEINNTTNELSNTVNEAIDDTNEVLENTVNEISNTNTINENTVNNEQVNEDNTNKKITISITKTASESNFSYDSVIKFDDKAIKVKAEVSDLNTEQPNETVSVSTDDILVDYGSKLDFGVSDDMTITKLTNQNSVVMNEYQPQSYNNLINQIYQAVVVLNAQKTQLAGQAATQQGAGNGNAQNQNVNGQGQNQGGQNMNEQNQNVNGQNQNTNQPN